MIFNWKYGKISLL